MKTIGTGNVGSLLATMFNKNPLLFSTAHQDTINFFKYNVISVSEDGSGKRFRSGEKIWIDSFEEVENALKDIKSDQVVIFSSLGGGSGSSSLSFISKILLNQNNQVLVVCILPYRKEFLPAIANSVQALNSLLPLMPDVSVMLFDNEKLRKTFGNDWNSINEYIIHRSDYIVNLIRNHTVDEYSPVTLDQSELDSVVFGGGFIDYSDTFLEEENPKFEYGSLDKTTKNCLLVMYVDSQVKSNSTLRKYHSIFTDISSKMAGKVSNSRFISGIIRAELTYTNSKEGVDDRAYIIIASGLNIEKYMKKISRLRDVAIKKAVAYMEVQKASRIIGNKENKLLNI